jgi:small Trp-rich protein
MLGYHQDSGAGCADRTWFACLLHDPSRGKRMFFVIIGVLLILLNLFNIKPFGAWNYEVFGDLWKFVLPFIFAVIWWVWSDVSGLNKRREMERMEKKKKDRRQENLEALGMDTRARRKAPRQDR